MRKFEWTPTSEAAIRNLKRPILRSAFDKKYPGVFAELYDFGYISDFRNNAGSFTVSRTLEGARALDYHERYES